MISGGDDERNASGSSLLSGRRPTGDDRVEGDGKEGDGRVGDDREGDGREDDGREIDGREGNMLMGE